MTRSSSKTPANDAKPKVKPKAKAKPAAKKATKKAPPPPDASELQTWRFTAVPAGSIPEALDDCSIVGALDLLVDLGLDDHELLAWTASDESTMVEDDGSDGLTFHGDPATARIVRFGGRAALRAGLGAHAMAGTESSLPADLASDWIAARARNRDGANNQLAGLSFYICELLVLGDRPELDRAWQTGNLAAWRYELAVVQNRPLMARLWQSRLSKANGA